MVQVRVLLLAIAIMRKRKLGRKKEHHLRDMIMMNFLMHQLNKVVQALMLSL